MKNDKKIIIVLMLFMLVISGIANIVSLVDKAIKKQEVAESEWEINNDTIFIDDENVYLSATPHTINIEGWVIFEFMSKNQSGNIDAIWGFNFSQCKPTKPQIWRNYSHELNIRGNAHYNITIHNITAFWNLGIENYTNYNVTHGNANNSKLYMLELYGNTTIIIAFLNHTILDGDSAIFHGLYNGIITVNKSYWDWKKFEKDIEVEHENHKGYDIWYCVNNVSVIAGKLYKVRAWLKPQMMTDGKYWFGIRKNSTKIKDGYWLDPWWESNWIYRKLIQVNASSYMGGGVALTNFPVHFNLDSSEYYNKMNHRGGGDIVFIDYFDNSTQFPHEIELFSSAGLKINASGWINFSTIRTTGPTWAWMYYCNNNSIDMSNMTDTWDSTFEFTHHMNESGSTTCNWIDSNFPTSNSYKEKLIDADGDTVSGRNTSSLLGSCVIWEPDGDHGISVSADVVLQKNHNRTFSAWVNPHTYEFGRGISGTEVMNIHVAYGFLQARCEYSATNFIVANSTYQLPLNQWSYVVVVFDSGWATFYVNGDKKASKVHCINMPKTSRPWRIGYASTPDYTVGSRWDGGLDEIRWSSNSISNASALRTEDWINCSYHNQFGTVGFMTIRDEIPVVNVAPTMIAITPLNSSTNVRTRPRCRIWANDTEGTTLTVTWATNESGSWINKYTNTSITANTTVSHTFSDFSSYNQKYYWRAYVDDGNTNYSEWFCFTTEAELATSADGIYPYNQSGLTVNITATTVGITPEAIELWYRYSNDNTTWTPDRNWYDTNFNYRKLLIIDHTKIEANLINFPILIYCNTDANLLANVQTDGDDIFFVLYNDNTTKLNHEIENYSSGTLWTWVNVTSLSSSVDTKIWMYYGNSTCASQENVAGTWDGNFIGVWHMNDNETGNVSDSTNNYKNGTKSGYPTESIGIIGNCQDFDGVDDCIQLGNDFGLDTIGNFTIEAWNSEHALNKFAQDGCIFGANINLGFRHAYTEIGYFLLSKNSSGDTSRLYDNTPIQPMAFNIWYYMVMTRRITGDIDFFLNTTNITDGTQDLTAPGLTMNYADYAIGTRDNAVDSYIFNGTIDEIRVSNIIRNVSWIGATYNTTNSPSTFFSIGNEQSMGWQAWSNTSNPDTATPWYFLFDFPNNTGYYEFYTVGNKTSQANETNPTTADARCYYNKNIPPIIAGEIPANSSTGIDPNPTMNITVDDPDNNVVNATWYSNSSGAWVAFAQNLSISTVSGTIIIYQVPINFSGYEVRYYWMLNLSDGNTGLNETYHFNTRAQYIPNPPSPFNVTTVNRTEINISWTNHEQNKTYLEWNTMIGWVRETGNFLANDTHIDYLHYTLLPNTQYFYQAWSYNITDKCFSSTNSSGSDTTVANVVPNFTAETPTNSSADVDKMQATVSVQINDFEGDTMDYIIGGGNVTYTTGTGGNGTYNAILATPLAYDTEIIWYINASDPWGYRNWTYNFTVRSRYIPSPPTSFNANTYNRTVINLSWTKAGNNNTYIEWNTATGWAWGTGTLLYNGSDPTYNHSNLVDGTWYYYQAWSYNLTDNGFSLTNATAQNRTVDNNVSNITGEIPVNESINILRMTQFLSVNISDPEGDTMTWTIEASTGDSNASATTNDTINCTLTGQPFTPELTITWIINLTDGFDWINYTYHFEIIPIVTGYFTYERQQSLLKLTPHVSRIVGDYRWRFEDEDHEPYETDWIDREDNHTHTFTSEHGGRYMVYLVLRGEDGETISIYSRLITMTGSRPYPISPPPEEIPDEVEDTHIYTEEIGAIKHWIGERKMEEGVLIVIVSSALVLFALIKRPKKKRYYKMEKRKKL